MPELVIPRVSLGVHLATQYDYAEGHFTYIFLRRVFKSCSGARCVPVVCLLSTCQFALHGRAREMASLCSLQPRVLRDQTIAPLRIESVERSCVNSPIWVSNDCEQKGIIRSAPYFSVCVGTRQVVTASLPHHSPRYTGLRRSTSAIHKSHKI